MYIRNFIKANNFNFLKIEVTPCNQSSSTDRTCASDDEIKQQLEEAGNFKVQVYSVNKVVYVILKQVINPNKIGSDYVSIYLDDQSYLSFVPKKISKYANIYFRQYQFQNSLDLYPFNEDQNLNFVSIDNTETKEITDLGRDSDTIYAAFYFRKSPITILVERKNQNVTDLLSKLGGLLQISLIVMGFIISAYNKITMFVELSNKIYEFSPDVEEQTKQHQQNLKLIDNAYEEKQFKQEYYVNREGQQQKIPNSEIKHKSKILRLFGKSQPDKHIMLIDRPTTENNECVNQGLNDNEDKSNQNTQLAIKDHNILAQRLNCVSGLDYFKKQINLILNRSQPLRFNMKIFVNQLCLRKAFSNSLSVLFYNQAVDKINEQLDVFNILTKLNEIDKLKEILLTNSQQLLFDFASKPIISMIEEKEMPISRTFLENRARHTNVPYQGKRSRKSQVIQTGNKSFFRTQKFIGYLNKWRQAYDLILQQSADQHPQHEVNRKLIKKLGDEMQTIFKLSKLLDFDGIRRLRANSNIDLICRNTQNVPEEMMNK
ncbi:unnamed protein product (macronuclear) [Paramecium tetraurelia]|uniref:Uncharacterized protein n=1 Tax=Paramecium tetraurelia TaxID=5888 RepID=A0EBM5_PARTE|nr:uncharacterized protein GSPATT00025426001 [Paramecium tetraurelia]CAK92692.1 unnamed protein product [Paramecium tetraurelia]|eukprot:XP_001460089.1 hypothetical protein (macronuclear) [Paramecium tetraurelia strain d4-2]